MNEPLPPEPLPPDRDAAKLRATNIRTALVMLLLAVSFFIGAIASKYMGGYEVGLSVVGLAVLVFLVFAIGRNLRSRK